MVGGKKEILDHRIINLQVFIAAKVRTKRCDYVQYININIL